MQDVESPNSVTVHTMFFCGVGETFFSHERKNKLKEHFEKWKSLVQILLFGCLRRDLAKLEMGSIAFQNTSCRLLHCKGVLAVLTQYYRTLKNKEFGNLPFKEVNPSSKGKKHASLFYVQTAD